MKNKFTISIICFFTLISSYIYLSPYITLYNFNNVLQKNKIKEFNKYINFASLRISLQEQIYDIAYKKTYQELEDSDNINIKMMLISPILKKIVKTSINATITPYGLQKLLETGEISSHKQVKREGKNKKSSSDEKNINLYYKNINNFILETNPKETTTSIKALWVRSYLVYWKLESIEISKNN